MKEIADDFKTGHDERDPGSTDALIRRCELEWNAGLRPNVRDLIDARSNLPASQIVELLRVDQLRSWQSGEPRQAHTYLRDFPELHKDPDAAFDLIWSEYHLRTSLGDAPPLENYERDYPQYAALLRRQYEVYQWVERAGSLGPPDESSSLGGDDEPDDFALDLDHAESEFVILKLIGRGSMGVVFKARQRELDRVIAVKMIRAGVLATDAEIARFRREAQSLASIDHPGIVRVHGFRWLGRCPYLMMEFVDGSSLAQRLVSGPLPPRVAAILLEQLAEAIEVAHQSQVIHRDLKPANVLIDRKGVPKIVDFGLGKRLNETDDLSSTGHVLGTASYMSPEQALGRGRECDELSDVYSLGAILYEMLTGRPPLQAATVVETLRLVVEAPPVPVRRLNPSVHRDLETICMKCLRKEPRLRYGSAHALARDLIHYQLGEPIKGRPVGIVERGLKCVARHPSRSALAAVSAICLFLIAAFVSWRESRLNFEAFFGVGDLEAAPISDVPRCIERLRTVHPRELPLLEAVLRRPSLNRERKLRAMLALLPYRTEYAESIFQFMLIAEPNEQGVLRSLLENNWSSFQSRLQSTMAEPSIAADLKLSAATALIGFEAALPNQRPWDLLRHSADPQFRTDLIHRLAPAQVSPFLLSEQLKLEPDASIRRALLQALGEYPDLPGEGVSLEELLPELEQLYCTDPDPGVHASAAWLLKRLRQSDRIKQLDRSSRVRAMAAGRGWYLNAQGQTLIVLQPTPNPAGTFKTLGAINSRFQVQAAPLEPFAIGMTEVTWEQFWKFQPRHRPVRSSRTPGPDEPVYDVNFPDAVAYCQWLNQNDDASPIRGYRLPTLAEWAYASAAGATTARHYGGADESLVHFAQYSDNAHGEVRPVGLLKPNDFGLFDSLGNVNEWCSETVDRAGKTLHVVMGRSCSTAASFRADHPLITVPEASALLHIGFRVACSLQR